MGHEKTRAYIYMSWGQWFKRGIYIYKKDSFIQFLYGEGDRTITKIDLVADPRIDYLIYDKKLPPWSLVAGLQWNHATLCTRINMHTQHVLSDVYI